MMLDVTLVKPVATSPQGAPRLCRCAVGHSEKETYKKVLQPYHTFSGLKPHCFLFSGRNIIYIDTRILFFWGVLLLMVQNSGEKTTWDVRNLVNNGIFNYQPGEFFGWVRLEVTPQGLAVEFPRVAWWFLGI